MSSRFLPSLVASAALQAFGLAGVALAAEPGAAVVVAQLGPTSPGFKMGLNRGETGAPEATAIGAVPIEKKPIAAKGAEWRGNSSHPSSEKDEAEKTAGKCDQPWSPGLRPGRGGAFVPEPTRGPPGTYPPELRTAWRSSQD